MENNDKHVSWKCHICGCVYSPNVVQCPKCSPVEGVKPTKQLLTEETIK